MIATVSHYEIVVKVVLDMQQLLPVVSMLKMMAQIARDTAAERLVTQKAEEVVV